MPRASFLNFWEEASYIATSWERLVHEAHMGGYAQALLSMVPAVAQDEPHSPKAAEFGKHCWALCSLMYPQHSFVYFSHLADRKTEAPRRENSLSQ